jgi:hypothetical protein
VAISQAAQAALVLFLKADETGGEPLIVDKGRCPRFNPKGLSYTIKKQ